MLAKYIDQTALRPFFNKNDLQAFLEDAKKNNYASVCLPPYLVPDAYTFLKDTEVKVCTVIGFPLGYSTTETKLAAAKQCIAEGATEIDIVINISAFKSGLYDYVKSEIEQLTELAHGNKSIIKVIIETAYLTDDEVKKICEICASVKVDFVKTSTGFAPEGAKLDTIKLMRKELPSAIQIKASGGITTKEQALEFIEAGATRIGTSSGNKIVN